MNSLASILYSSSSSAATKRKNLSFQPTSKPSRCQAGMLFRSSTPKTPLQPKIKTTITAHPTTLTTSSSSISLSINSPQSPRCSTPLYAKQRRTRPFIACELCRQRAFQSINSDENKKKNTQIKKKNEKQLNHQHSATLNYYQYQTNNSSSSIRRRRDRRRSSNDQLLVWII